MNDENDTDDPEGLTISGKDLERHFATQDALLEFARLFEREDNDRAIAIVGAAFLDTLLEHVLITFLVDDESEVKRLMGYDRPFGTYGNKIAAVYCLGLISKIIRDDLRYAQKIRNKFAHDLVVSFDDDPIRSWCSAMRWHEVSLLMKPPKGASPRDIFQVGVNQLVAHLNGIVSLARLDKRKVRPYP